LKIDFVTQFYVFPVKLCQTDILQLCTKLTILFSVSGSQTWTTNYRKKSPLRHLYLPSNVTSRHYYLGNHFRTLLLIDTLVDLVVT